MLPPLVERELRVALLRRDARRQWRAAAWTAGGITFLFLLVLGAGSTRSMGRTLFHWLFALGCAGMVARGFGLTADLFSEERRNGTLGLLVLTGLRPLEIFVNKLMGAVLLTVYGLLGGLPFFAISFLIGGVPPVEFICALAFLANGLLFCIAVGSLASVLYREGGQAQIAALAVAVVLGLATPAMHWVGALVSGPGTLARGWLTLSPGYAPYLVFTSFAGGSPQLFWIGSGITLGYSITALLFAAVILQYTWRDGPTLAPVKWRERWQAWVRGNETWRWRLRVRLLDKHPFCWLAARDRRPVFMAQIFLVVVAVLWVGGWMVLGHVWLGPRNAFVSSIVLHLGLNWLLAYAAAKQLGEERLSGGFEVLLTTPLGVEEIVEDQRRAVMIQFRRVALAAILMDVTFLCGGSTALGWSAWAISFYAAVSVLWLMLLFAMHLEAISKAMWISTWTGRPAYAALQTALPSLWLLCWTFIVLPRQARVFSQWSMFPFVCMAALAVMLTAFKNRGVIRVKLIAELRQIACAPIPARGDKRFKKWVPQNIFPPGRWGEFPLGNPPKSKKPPR